LGSGRGVRKDEVVFLQVPESAKPLLVSLQKVILDSGAHPLIQYLPDGLGRDFYEHASDAQLKYFPHHLLKGRIRQADHFISVIAETDKHELEGIDPKKIMDRQLSLKPYLDWRNHKEASNKFTWTLGMYATPAMAKEAGLSLKSCWNQIIKACYLDDADPVKKWQSAETEIDRLKTKLNKLRINTLRIISKNTDLTVGLGSDRQWLGGGGRNIPSFEIFISPDWRRTSGHIHFDMPLYHFGSVIKDIHLEFKEGMVVNSSASVGKDLLVKMIEVNNADKIGEFSLTDKRLSRIDKFMAETLFDENYGGKYGNTHIALGMAYKESYPGPISHITDAQWQKMGYNDSTIHTDIISTENRTVTAFLSDGSELLLYKDGKFLI
ncbi:MAG TPA: aminopeptidase, partial [Patescibacteria group bacterium]